MWESKVYDDATTYEGLTRVSHMHMPRRINRLL